eukprot:TRINITY_DN23350_c0_g1_i1.p1 TRINITY_DN23350_c0_g1~~TRINITY_DN23350_c0_g1_i1.p1  ORF type:complete len:565 (+),score=112.58 TRINITY_DN23350_c0_g1_i1:115-1695(+)
MASPNVNFSDRGLLTKTKSVDAISAQFLLGGVAEMEISDEYAFPSKGNQNSSHYAGMEFQEIQTRAARKFAEATGVDKMVEEEALSSIADFEVGGGGSKHRRYAVEDVIKRRSKKSAPDAVSFSGRVVEDAPKSSAGRDRCTDEDIAKIEACREELKLASWRSHGMVDCGCCGLDFQSAADPSESARAVLVIKIRRRARGVRHRRLWAALRSAVSVGVAFRLIYDLRCPQPGITFMNDLIKFHEEHMAQLTKHLKCMAFLVRESIATATTQRMFGKLVEARPQDCPCAVVHSPKAADSFFQLKLGSTDVFSGTSSRDSFVSLVNVRETTGKDRHSTASVSHCYAVLAPVSRSQDTTLITHCEEGSASPASQGLQTLRALKAKDDAFGCDSSGSQPVSFYALPNGDVRVVQSLPAVVTVEQTVDSANSFGMVEDPSFAPDRSDSRRPSIHGSPTNDDAMHNFVLKFECKTDVLQQLRGTHFHVGELIVDAEMQSMQQPVAIPGKPNNRSCLAAFVAILCSTNGGRKR